MDVVGGWADAGVSPVSGEGMVAGDVAVKLFWVVVYIVIALLAVFGPDAWTPFWVGILLASLVARTVDL